MSRLRAAARKAAAVLFPWPSKTAREHAIEAARQEKARSLAGAASAEAIETAIERMAAENHFAGLIAEQIIRRHRHA